LAGLDISYRDGALPVNLDKINQWLTLMANVGVVVGIIFLAFEIRTNTATNRIAIRSASQSNWVEINGGIAGNRELASVIEKAIAGEELDRVEARMFHHHVRQYANQGILWRDLYRDGLASEQDVVNGFVALRRFAEYERYREELAEMGTTGPMILDEDGFEKWFEAQE
jgi:hypothetical protein